MAVTGQIKTLTLYAEPNPNEKLDLLPYKAIEYNMKQSFTLNFMKS